MFQMRVTLSKLAQIMRRDRGAVFLSLPTLRGGGRRKSGLRGENAEVWVDYQPRHCEEHLATKQSILAADKKVGLLRRVRSSQ